MKYSIFYESLEFFHTRKKKSRKERRVLFFGSVQTKSASLVEEGKEILVSDFGIIITDPFKHFVGMVPEKGCCYALNDATMQLKNPERRS